jgi:hypothetical protein
MIHAGKAVLEHHFDNHEYCGNWCQHKNKKTTTENDDKYYHNKTIDAALYETLQSIIARFISSEALKEVAHNIDTCAANESFNNTIAWLEPKKSLLWDKLSQK